MRQMISIGATIAAKDYTELKRLAQKNNTTLADEIRYAIQYRLYMGGQ